MIPSLESCSTLTFVLAIMYIAISEGQGNACDINSRPHPQGLCGPRLSRAHSNLCFLLNQAYPKHFPGKRSVDSGLLVNSVYRIPLSVLAEIDISKDNLGAFHHRRESPNTFTKTNIISRDITETTGIDTQPGLSHLKDMTKALDIMLKKRGTHTKRVLVQTSMVCDCCYNMCTPRHLATYC